jgi:hypothetical protein
MKILDLSRYALGICVGIAIFAGCSSGGSQVAPAGPMQQSDAQSGVNMKAPSAKPFPLGLGGEVLNATNVTLKTYCYGKGAFVTDFSASGTASGPYPGSFLANGHWMQGSNFHHYPEWYVYEYLTIDSRKRSFVFAAAGGGGGTAYWMTCKTLGPAYNKLGYETGKLHGVVYFIRIYSGYLKEIMH